MRRARGMSCARLGPLAHPRWGSSSWFLEGPPCSHRQLLPPHAIRSPPAALLHVMPCATGRPTLPPVNTPSLRSSQPPASPRPFSEASASFNYPQTTTDSKCFKVMRWSACVDYPKLSNSHADVTVALPNEHVIWVRKHAGLQKALVGLNKALDKMNKLALDSSGMC
jgi:hypothetical protein